LTVVDGPQYRAETGRLNVKVKMPLSKSLRHVGGSGVILPLTLNLGPRWN
jgi:hypothetical protein